MTEAQLLKAYADRRDAEAFAEIVRRYQRLIFATCRRTLHHPGDADDAVQETFLRLAQKPGELRGNLGGWLHACARHVSIDSNRRRSARKRNEAAAQPAQNSMDPKMEITELREHLDRALEKLAADQRELIIQRFFVGRSQVDLAAQAGVSPSAITHRISGAIEALRSHLKSLGCGAIATGGIAILISALEAEHASAAVPAALTANVLKIGLSGTPPRATAGGSAAFTASMKALALFILIIAVGAGILFSLFDNQSATKQAPAPAAAPTSAPVMTVVGSTHGEMPAPPQWQSVATPARRGPLSGRVIDSDGKPIAGAVISLSGDSGGETKTNANGEYAFTRIGRGGISRIGVVADGFLPIEPYIGKDTAVQLSPDSQARRDMVLQRGVRLTVTVTDSQGKPFAGVTVSGGIIGDEFHRTIIMPVDSDRTGHAHFTLPVSKDSYSMGAITEGYAPAHAMVPADSVDKLQTAVLVLEKGIDVTGTAICSDGKPATGWSLTATPPWWTANLILPEAVIDSAGNFTFHNITPGPHVIELYYDNSGRQIATVNLPPATQPFRIDVPGDSPSKRVKLFGRVRFIGCRPDIRAQAEIISLARQDFSNAWIQTSPRNDIKPKLARNEGWFEFKSLLPGEYRLSIDSTEIEANALEHVQVPGNLPEIEVQAARKAHITGTVVAAADGAPLSHFAVRVRKLETIGNGPNYGQDENWTQVDNSDGRFDVPLVGPGIYQVQGSAQGYAGIWSAAARIEPSSGTANVVVKLSPGGSLIGRVVAPDGTPIAGAKVIPLSMASAAGSNEFFGNESGAVATDATGHFALPHLAPGEESLKVIDTDYAPTSLPKCTVTEGKSTDVGTVTMPVGGAVMGTVFDGDGKPAPNVVVQFQGDLRYRGADGDAAALLASVTTDSNGRFHAEHLPTQLVYVNLADRWTSDGVIRRVIRPVDGKTATLDFGGTAALTGRCVKDGQPLPNTHLRLCIASPYFGELIALGTTDADGHFIFRGIPAGPYTLFMEDKTSRQTWTRLQDVIVSDPPGDLGDVKYDLGDVLIQIKADDPADLKKVAHVEVKSIDFDSPWLTTTIDGVAQSAANDQWLFKGVRPGPCRVFAKLQGAPAIDFTIAFDRKAAEPQTRVQLHLPRATATLNINYPNPSDSSGNVRVLPTVQNLDGTIQIYLGIAPSQADSFNVPSGTYRAMEFEDENIQSARRDVAPITLGANEHRDWTITPAAKGTHLVAVDVRLWQADGTLAADATPILLESEGTPIALAKRTGLGALFYVPPGHYHVMVNRAGKPPTSSEIDVASPSNEWERLPSDITLN
jgi:RNA polymerase sigma factor (sigma-70 family)